MHSKTPFTYISYEQTVMIGTIFNIITLSLSFLGSVSGVKVNHPVAGVDYPVAGVAHPVAGVNYPVAGVAHPVAGVFSSCSWGQLPSGWGCSPSAHGWEVCPVYCHFQVIHIT